jgi:methyl-accepting chemotaxis protein
MKQTKLKTLLGAGFGLVLLLLLIVGIVSVLSARSLTADLHDLTTRRIPVVNGYGDFYINALGIRANTLQLFSLRSPSPETTTTLDNLSQLNEKRWAELDRIINLLAGFPRHSAEVRRQFDEVQAAFGAWRKLFSPLDANLRRFVTASRNGDAAAYRQAYEELETLYPTILPASVRLATAIDSARNTQIQHADQDADAATSNAQTGSIVIISLMLGGTVLSVLIGVGIYRGVMRLVGGEPSYASDILQAVASGDLTAQAQLHPGDTTSMLYMLQVMVSKLRALVDTISSNSNHIAAASEQLSATSDSIATSSENQSQAAASMAASVEQMTVSINHVADSANIANQLAQQSGAAACDGAQTIRDVVADIGRVAQDVSSAAANVEELGSHSHEIASVVSIIKDVADQTNLLALNAAIEAARAGEQGRGFAVVADEVRKLAERTASSTEDISRIVTKISLGTEHAVQTMQHQSENVKTTVELSGHAGQTIDKINHASQQVVDAVAEISLALSEQSSASTLIAQNVEKIATMSEDNTLSVQQAAQAAHDLTVRAAELQEVVSRFKV